MNKLCELQNKQIMQIDDDTTSQIVQHTYADAQLYV